MSVVAKAVVTVRLVSVRMVAIVRSVSPATWMTSPTLNSVLNFVDVPVRVFEPAVVATVPAVGLPAHSVGGVPGKTKLVGSTITPATFVLSANGLPATSVTLLAVTW